MFSVEKLSGNLFSPKKLGIVWISHVDLSIRFRCLDCVCVIKHLFLSENDQTNDSAAYIRRRYRMKCVSDFSQRQQLSHFFFLLNFQ